MFNFKQTIVLGGFALILVPGASWAQARGSAASFPWAFQDGTDTARQTAYETADRVAKHAGYAVIPLDVAKRAWRSVSSMMPAYGSTPSKKTLAAFAAKAKVSAVLYGSVKWHTRSIWVGAGPKTISTATATVYVYNAKTGAIYKDGPVEGRSDEKSNGYKIAAAILVTPLVTVVSGGPKTPQEQRAVQIAMGNAFAKWVNARR